MVCEVALATQLEGGLSKTSALRATGVPSLHDTGKGDRGGSVPADLGPGPWGSGLCVPRRHPTPAVRTEQKQSWTQTQGQPWRCQLRAPGECGVMPRAGEGSVGGGRSGPVGMGRRAGMGRERSRRPAGLPVPPLWGASRTQRT